jgi:predicted transcriptional regulator
MTQLNLTARQIKAGRALLDWSQDDLASASQLSVATIRKLEIGHISPRGKTTRELRRSFEDAGLEFIEPGGVRHKPEHIVVYQGSEGIRSFFDDVYNTVQSKAGDVVVVCASERPFTKALGYDLENGELSHHVERMKALNNGTKVKCILTEDASHLPGTDYCEYRQISRHYVDSVPFYVYDDKYAIVVFEADPSPKITVIQSPVIARAFRRQFHSMWDKASLLSTPGASSTISTMIRKSKTA